MEKEITRGPTCGCGCLEIPVGVLALVAGICDGYVKQKSLDIEWSIEDTPILIEQVLRGVSAHPVIKYIPLILQCVSSATALVLSSTFSKLLKQHQVQIESIHRENGTPAPKNFDEVHKKVIKSVILHPIGIYALTWTGHFAGRALGHVM